MTQDPGSAAFRYYAFISYSHQDKAWADWLHKALETYVVPKRLVGQTTAAGVIPKRLIPIFRDRDELASANDLGCKVNDALAQAANLIVICSPRSAASHWVQEEVLAYNRLGRSERVFCLIVDGEPHASDVPGREGEECFAPALRFQLDPCGQPTGQQAEPIAADARNGKDGKENAKLKLIAGLLDVGFDALKQRELQRRTRRLVAIATFAVAMMALTSTLAIVALISRHAAEIARMDAERRQEQAEDILGFMLGNLRKKLTTVGRLDLMRSVDDEATAYFKTLDPRDLTDTALEQQARLLTDIGQVRLAEGKLGAASAAFREALQRSSALYARAPAIGQRLFDKAQADYWIGLAAMQQGDYASAEAMFRNYHDSAVKLAAMDRSNFDWQKEVAYGLQTLAAMDEKMGRTTAAERGMREQLAMYRRWLVQRPADLQLRFEAANVLSWLGSLALEQGQLAAASGYFLEQANALKHNMLAEPGNANWQADSVDALALLASAQEHLGQRVPARATLASATALAAALYARDPDNNDWRAALARCRLSQSELEAAAGQSSAMENAALAESLLLKARAVDPKSQPVMESLVHAHDQLAQLDLSGHDLRAADKNVASSLALIEPAWKAGQKEGLRVYFARTRLLQGDLAQREGRPVEAGAAWKDAETLLLGVPNQEVPFGRLEILARALQRLGHDADAAPYLRRLTVANYVPLQPWPDRAMALASQAARRARPAHDRNR
ncbi:MAG: toll/interleukin-1 receptor domain-containing protein [Rhodanobacter sp.]